MTRQEKDALQQIEATGCRYASSGKYSHEALLIYFKLLKTIMDKDKFHVDQCMEKLKWIMDICNDVEAKYDEWRHKHNKTEEEKTFLYNEVDIESFKIVYWNCMLQRTFWSFEDFILFMERNREKQKQFYLPRRGSLKQVVDELQALEMSKTQKFYGLSMPSRVGKSTICLLFLAWVAMRKPNSHSAMGGHSGLLAKGFYKEMMNFFTSEDYNFERIYRFHHPEYARQPVITDKSAEDLTITLGDNDRFGTISMRGIDGTWTGAIDISKDGYLYVDDLVRDREHSLNPTRMENTWQEYLNKMVDRKNDGAKELMVGTLWNVYDPLYRLSEIYANNPAYVFKRIPALDEETDESNFQYVINGFSTQYYRDMRERLDDAEWMAKYQQKPQIREGILFSRDIMKRFKAIPDDGDTEAYCDPALGGGDFLSCPITRTINGRHKVISWVYDPSSTKVTVPKVVDNIIRYHVTKLTIEIDGGAGTLVHKELLDEIKARDCMWCEVIPIHSSTRLSKTDKIKGRADYIKDNFEFLEDDSPDITAEYKKAFADMCMWTTIGKNLHDDAPDSIAGQALQFKPFSENGVIDVPDFNPFRSFGGLF